jgi:DNA-directed RNA polymerase specialized sigma24 family protein
MEFHVELFRSIHRTVRSSLETTDDACAFAWLQFLREQPDRDQNWQGWLFRVAQREAWRLNALDWKERDHVDLDGKLVVQPDPRDRYDEHIRFDAALQELKKLPPALQRVVLIRSQVWKQEEVAEVMGIRPDQVEQLLRAAAVQLAEVNESRHDRERPVASPRAARLRELEDDPPAWLTSAIGRCPARSKSSAGVVLAWRRAALAIEDYRTISCHDSPTEAIGLAPSEPAARRAYARAQRAMGEVSNERERRHHGIER